MVFYYQWVFYVRYFWLESMISYWQKANNLEVATALKEENEEKNMAYKFDEAWNKFF